MLSRLGERTGRRSGSASSSRATQRASSISSVSRRERRRAGGGPKAQHQGLRERPGLGGAGRRPRRARRRPPRTPRGAASAPAISPGSTKPASVEYMPGGKRGERPSRQRSPWVTSTITAGSVRGKWSRPQDGQCRAWPPWLDSVAAPQKPQKRWPRCQCARRGHRRPSRPRRPAGAARRCAARPAAGRRRLFAELAGEPGDTVALAQEDALRRQRAAELGQRRRVQARRVLRPQHRDLELGQADHPRGRVAARPRPARRASRRRCAARSRPWRRRPAAMAGGWHGVDRWLEGRPADSASRLGLHPCATGRGPPIFASRKAGDGRGPRQTGQVRKEAAVTSFAPGRRPAFHLARPSRPMEPQLQRPADYRVLARAYRPTRLSALIGQEALVRTLKNAFASGASRTPSCSRASAASARPRPPGSSPAA